MSKLLHKLLENLLDQLEHFFNNQVLDALQFGVNVLDVLGSCQVLCLFVKTNLCARLYIKKVRFIEVILFKDKVHHSFMFELDCLYYATQLFFRFIDR